MSAEKNIDVAIIGAGPAGAVAASYLAEQGYGVIIVEKQIFPRFVIGESLLPHSLDHLEEAGLLDGQFDEKFQIKAGAIFFKDDKSCRFSFDSQYTEGARKHAWQVKRAEFDKFLIDKVADKEVEVLFETEVTDVESNDKEQLLTCKGKEGEELKIRSRFLIDASGYGRVLPRLFDLSRPSELPARGALFTHIKDPDRAGVETDKILTYSFLDNNAWLWVIPYKDGTSSVGMVSLNEIIDEYAQNDFEKFKALIRTFPDLDKRFSSMELLFKPKKMKGYSVGVEKMYGDGYVLCGNSTEFLDPIFSSGVMLATASGLLAAKLTDRKLQGGQVDWKEEYEDHLRTGVEVFRSYVEGWYDGSLQTIFFAENTEQSFKEKICSLLAGYVWDSSNPFQYKHKTILKSLSKTIEIVSGRNGQ